jgi:hypothetical protein
MDEEPEIEDEWDVIIKLSSHAHGWRAASSLLKEKKRNGFEIAVFFLCCRCCRVAESSRRTAPLARERERERERESVCVFLSQRESSGGEMLLVGGRWRKERTRRKVWRKMEARIIRGRV